MELSALLQPVMDIARGSGRLILDIYQRGDFKQQTKSDNTPVTSADLASHKFIIKHLNQLTPNIPVLSEEDTSILFNERKKWMRYWLVDPLDGTQEFIAGTGDFSTMIALVENNQPILGVVYNPVYDVTYYALKEKGAWKILASGETVSLSVLKHRNETSSISIAISRRQNVQTITDRLSSNYHYDFIPLGSASLKSCLVAEGSADCYLRLGPTGEWDTAATQCILQEAGGRIINLKLNPLSYNKRESLINSNFIALGDTELPWKEILLVE